MHLLSPPLVDLQEVSGQEKHSEIVLQLGSGGGCQPMSTSMKGCPI